jgi:hypothetical protein
MLASLDRARLGVDPCLRPPSSGKEVISISVMGKEKL